VYPLILPRLEPGARVFLALLETANAFVRHRIITVLPGTITRRRDDAFPQPPQLGHCDAHVLVVW
jgi:hypothetical protein